MQYILKKLSKYKFQILGIIILTIVYSVSILALPSLLSDIVNKGIINSNNVITVDIHYILIRGLIMISISIIGGIAAIAVSYVIGVVMSKFGVDIRKDIYHKSISMSLKEYNQFSTATLITRTSNDVNKIQQALMMVLKFGTMTPLMFTIALVMAIKKSALASKILLITMPLFILILLIILKYAFPMFKKIQKKVDKLTLIMRENLTGVRVIRAFNNEEKEKTRFDESNKDLTKIYVKVNYLFSIIMPLVMVIMNLTSVGIIYITANAVESGKYDYTAAGNMIAVMEYITHVMFSFIMFCIVFSNIPSAAASSNRIKEIIDTKISIKNSDNTKSIQKIDEIEFKDVNYTYDKAEMPTLNNISFKAQKGETIAIIGGTGSGKSTLINLIPRFYDVTGGEIFIDGINIKDLDIASLRHNIGFITQKAILFNDTVKNNIKYGKEDATDEEVIEAAKIAQADSFIMEKENGYDYLLEQQGKNLSGGQKQRLAIARAIIKKPSVFIFDDSFSALDFKTDSNLRKAIKPYTESSIVFIVAQRINSIINADKIIVLNDGEIVGYGKHSELMKNCTVYKEIALSQLNEEELNYGKAL